MPDFDGNRTQQLGRDLTVLARCGRLDPVVGREAEMDELLRILCRRTKSNPLLVGEPGVGKTALVEGLAQRMAAGDVPPALRNRGLFELQLGALLAGTQFRGDLEQRVQGLVEFARASRTLIFVDEIHLLVVAGRGSGMDAANLLKPILTRGDVPCIGATTEAEAAEMAKIDPAIERRFHVVRIGEPSESIVRDILLALRPRLEEHHHLRIQEAAIEEAVRLSLAIPGTRRNPDKALDLLENACASEQIHRSRRSPGNLCDSAELQSLRAAVAASLERLDLEGHIQAQAALEAHRQAGTAPTCEAGAGEATVGPEHVRAAALV